jgi:streptogramin lyase
MYSYGDTIWASGECSPVIWRINARTGRVRTIDLGRIPGPGLIGDVIQARQSAWVTTDAGQLLQLSPLSGRVIGHYRLPSHLGAGSLTYAAGSLWTSDFGDLDEGHGRVVRLRLP